MNFKVVILSLALIWSVSAVQAQDKKETTLFTNVKVFNGIDEKLMDVDVLVEGHLIKQVAKGIKAPKGTTVIDGGGRTLMPGMADTHVHLAFATLPQQTLLLERLLTGISIPVLMLKSFL